MYADGVLLVWKPVESYGPVTYIVQCSLEGRSPPCGSPPGSPGAHTVGPQGSAWLVLRPWVASGRTQPPPSSLREGSLHPPTGLSLTHSCVAQVAAGARWLPTSLTAATSPASFPGVVCTLSGRPASARRAWVPTAAPQRRSSWEGPATWVSRSVRPGGGGWGLPCHFTQSQARTGMLCSNW